MKKTLLLFIFFAFLSVKSQNIFKDDFASYTTGAELSGQGLWSNNPIAPNVGIGACLPVSSGSICSGTKIVDQNVFYENYGSSTKSIEIGPLRDGVAHIIDPAITNGDLYVAMVLNLATAPDESGLPVDFLRIINSDPTQVTFRLIVKNTGFGYKIGIRKGASSNTTVFAPDTYNYNENVLVVMKYSHLEGIDDDVANLFVNPDYASGEPVSPSATTAIGFDQSGAIDRVAFRLNYNTIASMPTGFAGLVSAATTWEGLSFLPLATNQFETHSISISAIVTDYNLLIHSAKSWSQLSFQIHSLSGALLEDRKITLTAGNSNLAIQSKLSSGIYLATLESDQGQKIKQKIIIP